MTLRYLTAGESHGPGLVAILDGLPSGLHITNEIIDRELIRRQQGYGAGPRMKIERDHGEILSGVMESHTTGAPLAIWIENRDHKRWQGKEIPAFTTPRPGHVDLVAALKYGYTDLRPGLERSSARETAARVAAGAICKHFLAQFSIKIGGYVVSIGEVSADLSGFSYEERIVAAEESSVRCPDPIASKNIEDAIENIIKNRNTLGGIIEVVSLGLPIGLGSHVQWDRRLEARLGAAVLGVQAMKGVEIGPAFENASLMGTQAQDPIGLDGEQLVRGGAKSGGTEGGITNGGPLIVRAAMKPIATTLTPQQTVDLAAGKQVPTQYERSDFCPVPRAVPILEAVIAIVLADAFIEKIGGDSIEEMKARFNKLPTGKLSDFKIASHSHTWWEE
jgi:chorismate synthase